MDITSPSPDHWSLRGCVHLLFECMPILASHVSSSNHQEKLFFRRQDCVSQTIISKILSSSEGAGCFTTPASLSACLYTSAEVGSAFSRCCCAVNSHGKERSRVSQALSGALRLCLVLKIPADE